MPTSFRTSPNVLFDTRVHSTLRISPGFVRVTLTGPQLAWLAPYGLDQRVKVLVPHGGYSPVFDDDVIPESEWRRRWRSLVPTERPAMRSYTTSAVRPGLCEVDLDFYVHDRPGPASAWADTAQQGERVLLSGPDVRFGNSGYGIQWRSGPATQFLLAGDETAFPAINGIIATLAPSASVRVMLEVGDAADAVDVTSGWQGRAVTVHQRGAARGGAALVDAIGDWTRSDGSRAAASGENFYAWLATESSQVSHLRESLHRAGISPGRVHSQGYWNNKDREL